MPDEPKAKPLRAIALRYDIEQSGAPHVVATGADELARQIIERAEQQGVPVRDEPALAEALARVELAQEIPEELFLAVAEVLVWAYGLERWLGRKAQPDREGDRLR